MKSKKYLIILLPIFIIILFATPVFAFTGTVQYSTNEFTNPYLNTSNYFSDVYDYVTGLGYSSQNLYNGSCSDIENAMENKAIFIWSGHGNPGEMVTSDVDSFNIYAQNSTYNLSHDLPSGSLTNEIVWFQGCSQADTDPSYGNLLDAVTSKSSGYTTAIGVDGPYNMSEGYTWNDLTWKYAYNQNSSITDVIYQAANDTGAGSIDLDPLNSSMVVEYYI